MVGDIGVAGRLRPAVVAKRRGQVAMAEPMLGGEQLAFGDEHHGNGMAEPMQSRVRYAGESRSLSRRAASPRGRTNVTRACVGANSQSPRRAGHSSRCARHSSAVAAGACASPPVTASCTRPIPRWAWCPRR